MRDEEWGYEEDTETYKLLWKAPELLRNNNHRGTVKGAQICTQSNPIYIYIYL